MQIDPINPVLNAPGSKRLKVRCGKPLSNFAKFNLRRYSLKVNSQASQGHSCDLHSDVDYSGHDMIFGHGGSDAAKAGPHTRYFFGSIHASCP